MRLVLDSGWVGEVNRKEERWAFGMSICQRDLNGIVVVV